jgi:hypothetical protein
MRLDLIQVRELDVMQQSLYKDLSAGTRENFKGFSAIAKNGELIGPWNPWLMFPKFGGAWNWRQLIRTVRPDIPVILSSGYSSAALERDAKATGVSDALRKSSASLSCAGVKPRAFTAGQRNAPEPVV